MTTGSSLRVGETILGGGVLALGLFIAIETAQMTVATGPGRGRAAPVPVPGGDGTARGGVGLCCARRLFGHIAHEGGFELDWRAVALVAGGLVAADPAAREAGLDDRHHRPVRRHHARLRQPPAADRRGTRPRPERLRFRVLQLRSSAWTCPSAPSSSRCWPPATDEARLGGRRAWKPSPLSATASPSRSPPGTCCSGAARRDRRHGHRRAARASDRR